MIGLLFALFFIVMMAYAFSSLFVRRYGYHDIAEYLRRGL